MIIKISVKKEENKTIVFILDFHYYDLRKANTDAFDNLSDIGKWNIIKICTITKAS